MAVIKAAQLGAMAREAIVLDLGDIGAQAEKILNAAHRKAEVHLAQAQAQARTLQEEAAALRQTAEQHGWEAGHAEGYERGMAEGLEAGRAAGHAEALQQTREQVTALVAGFQQVAEALDQRRQELERVARPAVMDLALRLAEKVVHRTLQVDPAIVQDQVEAALRCVLQAQEVFIQFHPEDRPLLEEVMSDLLSQFRHLGHLHLEEDLSVTRGGCRLRIDQGAVDATIEKQLERLVEAVNPR